MSSEPLAADRVKETTATTATLSVGATVDLGGPAGSTFQSVVAGIGDGNTGYFCLISPDAWQVFRGTVTAGSPDSLQVDAIIASSDSGAAITPSGSSTVILTEPAGGAYLYSSGAYDGGLSYRRGSVVSLGGVGYLSRENVPAGGGGPGIDSRWVRLGGVDSAALDEAFGSTARVTLYRGDTGWATRPEGEITVDGGPAVYAAGGFNPGSGNVAGGYFVGVRANGSLASPTHIATGDWMAAFRGDGYDGADFVQDATTGGSEGMAGLAVIATEDWGNTAHGSKVVMSVVPNGTVAQLDALTIEHDGGAVVGAPTGGSKGAGTVNASGLFVNGVAVGAGGDGGTATLIKGGSWDKAAAYAADTVVRDGASWYIANSAISARTETGVAVAGHTAVTYTSAAASQTITFSMTGDARVLLLTYNVDPQIAVSSVTSPNLIWTKLEEVAVHSLIGAQNTVSIWYALAGPTLTAETVTINLPSSWKGTAAVIEVSGADLSVSPFDANASLPAAISDDGNSMSISYSTTNPADLVLYWESINNIFGHLDPTPPAGFTLIYDDISGIGGTSDISVYYENVSTAQSGTVIAGGNGLIYHGWINVVAAVAFTSPGNPRPANDSRWIEVAAVDSDALDAAFGSTVGSLLTRKSTGKWGVLTPGSSGTVVTSNGTELTFSAGGGGGSGGLWGGVIIKPSQAATPFQSWVNQGGATVGDNANGVSLAVPASTGDSLRILGGPAPTPPYTIQVCIGLSARPGRFQQVGIGWMSALNTSSKLLTAGFGWDQTSPGLWSTMVTHWNTPTSWQANDIILNAEGNPAWLQIADDGTNFSIAISNSGAPNDFVTHFSGTKAGSWLDASGFGYVIFYANRSNVDASTPAIGTMFSYIKN